MEYPEILFLREIRGAPKCKRCSRRLERGDEVVFLHVYGDYPGHMHLGCWDLLVKQVEEQRKEAGR